jgi:hypothetical protein
MGVNPDYEDFVYGESSERGAEVRSSTRSSPQTLSARTSTAGSCTPTPRRCCRSSKGADSNERLLQRTTDGAFIAGIKVLTDPAVDATRRRGVSIRLHQVVLRQGTEMQRFDVPRQDAIDVRGIARVGFAFLHPQAVVRLHDAA